jgi:hypothetical protein
MLNAVQFAGITPCRIPAAFVSLLWQTALFVFLAAPARTGIVPPWFHDHVFLAATRRKKYCAWHVSRPTDTAESPKAENMLNIFCQNPALLTKVLFSTACPVNFS